MVQIAILLTTFNSSSFICEQIDSLLSQTIDCWDLFIVDDGSNDNTVSIITNYCKKYPQIHFVELQNKNNGPLYNFLYLLSIVEAKYYMFCDHDDVWLPEKIECSLSRIAELEKNNPKAAIVVHSDLKVVDKDLNIISNSFVEYASINPTILSSSKYHMSHSNCVVGCTMLFNSKAKALSFPVSKKALMHDSWISLNVISKGGIISFINKPLVLYRQHGNNTLGAVKKHASVNIVKNLRANYKQYMMAKEVCNINLLSFIIYRINYLIKR